jgi:hypothetical protein
MYPSIPLVFNVIGVIFEVVAIGWAVRMLSHSFKKWNLQYAKHASRSGEEHFKEEKNKRP